MKRLTLVLPLFLVGLFLIGCAGGSPTGSVKSANALDTGTNFKLKGDLATDTNGKDDLSLDFLQAVSPEMNTIYLSMHGYDSNQNEMWVTMFVNNNPANFVRGTVPSTEAYIGYEAPGFNGSIYDGVPYCMGLYEKDSGMRVGDFSCEDNSSGRPVNKIPFMIPTQPKMAYVVYLFSGSKNMSETTSYIQLPPVHAAVDVKK